MCPQRPTPLAPSNREQARNWNGDGGGYWVANADRFDETVAAYQSLFLATADLRSADRVLDVGCGAGRTTLDVARRVSDGVVIGVDLSAPLLEVARLRAAVEGLRNATFLQADVQIHTFTPASFDVVVSRHGAMFFGDPAAAFANIARCVRPGGRLVLLTWQAYELQEGRRTFLSILADGRDLPPQDDGPGPFALSDPARVRVVLSDAGFGDVDVRGVTEPMYVGTDPDDACRFVCGHFGDLVRSLDPHARRRTVAALRDDMAAHQTDRGVLYGSAAWVVTARRSEE
ncbi:MAG TPA: class I SAM-dependent methyltransferase [Actinomycetes bacterium]|nr:class I SAM-dependent methyltransferase [Actinomycetes bacterium]